MKIALKLQECLAKPDNSTGTFAKISQYYRKTDKGWKNFKNVRQNSRNIRENAVRMLGKPEKIILNSGQNCINGAQNTRNHGQNTAMIQSYVKTLGRLEKTGHISRNDGQNLLEQNTIGIQTKLRKTLATTISLEKYREQNTGHNFSDIVQNSKNTFKNRAMLQKY